jgi:hypothetical protein
MSLQAASSYPTYGTRRSILPHHPFHQETTTCKCPVHRNPSRGGALGHLGIVVLIAAYAIIASAHPWVNTVGFIFKVPELLLGALLYDMSYIAIN